MGNIAADLEMINHEPSLCSLGIARMFLTRFTPLSMKNSIDFASELEAENDYVLPCTGRDKLGHPDCALVNSVSDSDIAYKYSGPFLTIKKLLNYVVEEKMYDVRKSF